MRRALAAWRGSSWALRASLVLALAAFAYTVVRSARLSLTHDEAMTFVDKRRLAGLGVGWVDIHLAASAVVSRAKLWTADRRLADVARALRLEP